ncbi:MAG: hypothetical protein IJ077_08525 [Eubacterium sp.]|nr:hypothetical protein [Eubacterium sp.]
MSEFKELIDEYLAVTDIEDMKRLTKVIDCIFDDLKETDPEKAKKYITKIKLSQKAIPWDKAQAEMAVKKMKNKDGTTGEHWSYDKTTDVLEKRGYDFNPAEWYYVLNMVYSDYASDRFDTENYVTLAYDVISDIDAPKNATKKIFVAKHY